MHRDPSSSDSAQGLGQIQESIKVLYRMSTCSLRSLSVMIRELYWSGRRLTIDSCPFIGGVIVFLVVATILKSGRGDYIYVHAVNTDNGNVGLLQTC